MPLASWAALRQFEAIRSATGATLQFGAIAGGKRSLPDAEVREWLSQQGMECDEDTPPFVLTAILMKQLQHPRSKEILNRAQAGLSEADVGRERSGADFTNLADFILTSGFIRILGAHEQFERDVLKALFFYRPKGRSAPAA